MTRPHVLIVGAGIGGLTAALCLTRIGARVQIFEQAEELGEVGAGLQLSANAMQVLSALGLAEKIGDVAFEPARASFRDHQSGRTLMSVPLKGAHETRYGARYLHIHRADLHAVLLATCRGEGVNIETDHRFEFYDPVLRDERIDILVGADGIRSVVQDEILGRLGPQKPHFTGQVAWRGLVPADRLPPGLIPPDATVWMGPGAHIVSYYVRRGELINFVAVREQASWTEESWQQTGDIGTLRDAFADWDQPVTALLAACETCHVWGLFGRGPLPRWTSGNRVLLGDAAHPMLPFLAQGAAMAIEDAWVLAHFIQKISDLPEALFRYRHARRSRTRWIQEQSRKNAKIYHADTPFDKARQLIMLGAGQSFPAIRHGRLDRIYAYDATHKFPVKIRKFP